MCSAYVVPFHSELEVCVTFSLLDQRGSHPLTRNIVNVTNIVLSACLRLVCNNRKPEQMSSPIITPSLFFPSSSLHIVFPGKLAPRSKAGMLKFDLISEGASRAKHQFNKPLIPLSLEGLPLCFWSGGWTAQSLTSRASQSRVL